jgi:uncharacterized membrane protein YkoI
MSPILFSAHPCFTQARYPAANDVRPSELSRTGGEPTKREVLMNRLVRCVVAGLLLLPVLAAQAQEKKVPLKKVPKAVLKAVKDKFPGAEVKSASTEKDEKDDKKIVYEVTIKHKGSNIDVSVTPEGKIVSIEKQIAFKDLPEAVSAAVKKKYPKAKIKLTEEVTKGDEITYEILLVTTEKKTYEIVLDPKGKILKTESKDKKKED